MDEFEPVFLTQAQVRWILLYIECWRLLTAWAAMVNEYVEHMQARVWGYE